VENGSNLNLLNAVRREYCDPPASVEFGSIRPKYPNVLNGFVFWRVEHLRAGELRYGRGCLDVQKGFQ
jgi:hypothetical protein